MKHFLIVVDMQKGFCYPGKQFYSSENIKLVPAISTLLEYFRGNNLPVYFTEFVYSKDCPNLNGRLWQCERDYDEGGERCCYVGDPSTETIDELKPLPGELLSRNEATTRFSARIWITACAPKESRRSSWWEFWQSSAYFLRSPARSIMNMR